MNDQRHLQIEELFQKVVDLPPDRRSDFLEGQAELDQELRAEVEALLECLDDTRVASLDFLEKTDEPEFIGLRIGPYKVLELIGEGGFGAVYMAEQEDPIRRRVALKIIKLGMDTKQVIARFEAERQALALMDHPNIARVLDAGATPTGRPYFVMELVRGIPISDFCDEKSLSVQERLGLFVQVCRAVQHAHQKGVIHRDIKPSNVLVTLHDGVPVPKVIDFGIAKATDRPLTEKTLFTTFHQFVGTPEYMSPEQAEMSGLDVDTRTDIYSLGVLLYMLLTGRTPFEKKELERAAFGEIQRIIREELPPTPSQVLSRMGPEVETVAQSRQVTTQALGRLMRGELDWIVMKALEKDRTRRYETATSLAADVESHLKNEPVQAGPPGATYRLRKFVHRHRVGVMTGFLVVITLLVGLALAIAGFLQADRARDTLEVERDAVATMARTARNEAEKAWSVTRFMQQMLESVNPWNLQKQGVSMRFILDEAARRIEEGVLSEQPEVEATVRMTLGKTYVAMGLHDDAEIHLRAAVALRERTLGDEASGTLESRTALAILFRRQGRTILAEKTLRAIQDTAYRVLGERHPLTLTVMNSRGVCLWRLGKLAAAEALHRRTLGIRRDLLGPEHLDTLKSMINLGSVLLLMEKGPEAESLLRRVLETSRRRFGTDHSQTLTAMKNLAFILKHRKKYEEAEVLYKKALVTLQRILGDDHEETCFTRIDYFSLLVDLGKVDEYGPLLGEMIGQFQKVAARPGVDASRICYLAGVLLHCQPHHLVPSSNTWTRSAFQGLEAPCTELAMVAEKMLRKAVETIRLERGEDHPTWLFGMSLLATALFRQGRLEETEAQHVRLLRLQRQLAGEEDPQTMKAMVNLGIIFLYRKKLARAEAVLRRALELQEAHLGPDYPERHKAMYNLALVLKLQNRLEEAEPMHRRALDLQRRHLGDNHPETRQSLAHFLGLLHLLGRSEEHRRLTEAELERLRQAVERPGASARNHSDFARMLLTCNIEDLRDVDAAVASARRAVELSGGRVIPYLAVLVLACHQAGDLFETIRWQKRLVTLAAPAQPSKFTVVERSLVELLGKTRGAFGLLEATCHILAARLVKRVLAKRAKG